MKLSKQVGLLQSQLDESLPSRWIWIAGDLQEIGVQVDRLESQNTKLSQAANDKDQELFESQELVGNLLEALETLSVVADTPYPIDKKWLSHFVTEAIRKAKEK